MDFLHVGMKAHDIERSARCYAAALGIAWEQVREYRLSDITLDGRIAPSRVDFGFFAGDELGGLLTQLVHFKQPQPVPGRPAPVRAAILL